ncbi:MAG: HvfB family MNIO-type RiPP peptide maturase [Gammaproteobacteria bacterium]
MKNSTKKSYPVFGSGLGLRRDLLNELETDFPAGIDFMEVAPENWIGIGGKLGKRFRAITEKVPFVTHGLSLSIGSPAPLDENFIREIKNFLDEHNIRCYSEHLSYCSDQGHLYDLMPIPFTEEAVHYVADRIRRVQDILERKIAIENVSYYAAPGKEMDEINFIKDILDEADCDLLLDVNNIYVNSVNHHYDPMEFLQALPCERVAYCHIAGHYNEAEDLIVDTHGANVIDPVWDILDKSYELFGNMPTLLERDFNFPPMNELMQEVLTIRNLQIKWDEAQQNIVQAS